MVDCVGKELNIGDKVICADSRYADLLIGEVVKFTSQKVLVRYHRSEYGKEYTNEKLKEPYQIFKYEDVVWCKDCIHWYEREGVCLKIYSDGAVSPYAWQDRNPDDFCSYGERRVNG